MRALRLRLVALGGIGLFCWLLFLLLPQVQVRIELIWEDLVWHAVAGKEVDAAPVILAIDEKSLAELGAWPWSRETLARLSDQLVVSGARGQVFDVIFPESRPADDRLAETLKRNRAIIGQLPFANGEESTRQGALTGALPSLRCAAGVGSAAGHLANTASFAEVYTGHITPNVGPDGVIRSVPALLCVDGLVYPSLALRALLVDLGQNYTLTIVPAQGLFDAPYTLQISLADGAKVAVPLGLKAESYIDYGYTTESFATYSVTDLLNGRIPANLLQDKVVIVGATAFGLGDVVPTPLRSSAAGVELQARLLNTLLQGEAIRQIEGAGWVAVLITLLALILLILPPALQGKEGRVLFYPLMAVVIPLLMFAVQALFLRVLGVSLALGSFALPLALAALGLGVSQHRLSSQQGQRLLITLRAYLPALIAERAASSLPGDLVDAKRQDRILLNADIRNFSAFEAYRSPEETAALLHRFLTESTAIVEQRGGVIEELKGDSLLASWPLKANAAEVLQTARQLHGRITGVLTQSSSDQDYPLALGVGVEAGTVLVGSIGSSRRRVHTLLGETVTSVIRLQEMTQELAQPILIGDGFAREFPATDLQDLGSYLLPGLRKPRRVYALSDKVADSWEQLGSHLRIVQGGK